MKARNGHYIVSLESTYNEKSAGGLILDTTYNPNEHARVVGTVVAIPDAGGHAGIEVGDEVAMSYMVVSARGSVQDLMTVFHEEAPINPYLTQWSNHAGEKLQRIYHPGGKFSGRHMVPSPTAQGSYVVADSFDGPERPFKDWLGKFLFQNPDAQDSHERLFIVDGKQYWIAPAEEIHAFIPSTKTPHPTQPPMPKPHYKSRRLSKSSREPASPTNPITPVEGTLLCTPPDRTVFQKAGNEWIKVVHGELAGSWVYTDTRKAPEYEYWGSKYLVVEVDRCHAVAASRPEEKKSELSI
ncbi:hypothetical protein GCM10027051_31340 [Niabella terrae]